MISIDDFLANLDGVATDGHGGWMARCPAHGDVNPSLHVNLGDDGRILLKCFGGCTAEEVCHAIGLELKDIMPDNGHKPKRGRKAKARPAPSPRPSSEAAKKPRDYGRHVCYYEYKDENGAIAYRVDRRVHADGSKDFFQQHPDETSKFGWSWGVSSAGVQVLPFRLPELLAAAKAGKTVVIAEGEKDVLSIVNRLNLAATCNSGGAGKWQPSFARYFEGVPRVLIVSDKDPEFKKVNGKIKPHWRGQRHACDVEQKLLSAGYQGKIVKIVMPDVVIGGCGEAIPCKDFTDWCEAMDLAGQTVDRSAFQRVVADFGEWPQEWNFEAADLADLPRSQKSERRSSSSSLPHKRSEEDDGKDDKTQTDGRRSMGEAGRYGRPCPRSPLKERGWFEVDFQMDPKRIARFAVGNDALQFQGWERDPDGGEFFTKKSWLYDEIKCPPSRMINMALGCMGGFAESFKISNPQRTELICSLAMAWLRSRGKFFADKDNPMYSTSFYFDGVEGVLYGIQSDEFQSFLATKTNISRENKVFRFMMALIEDLTMCVEETPRVRPSKEWDRRGDVIYISNGDSRMYRVSATAIEEVQNGTDGVVFLRGSTLLPFKLAEGPGLDPFVHSMLFRYAALEKPSDVMNCRLWTLGLFACLANKPIILANGPAGSGKTKLFEGMKQFLGIRTDGQIDDTVTKMVQSDKGSEEFWIIVDKGRFEIFDNFDYKIKWADNDLQTASTNGVHKARVLYETDKLITQRANASIALTSNNAVFASQGGGLPDRIITVRLVGRPKVSKGPGELLADNMRNRDAYLTFIIRTLSKALADKKPVDESINKRHPEFAEFAVRCGRAMGCEAEAIRALSTAEIEKAVLPLMNDVVAKEVTAVLIGTNPPGNVSFTAGEMSEIILSRLGDDDTDEKTRTIFGSRRIGKTIARFAEDFRTLFEWSTRLLEGKTRYDFTGLTARGETVLDVIRGGLVGFNGRISESPNNAEGTGEFSENACENPPNPPHARALTPSSPFTREEENNGNYPNGDNYEDDLTF